MTLGHFRNAIAAAAEREREALEAQYFAKSGDLKRTLAEAHSWAVSRFEQVRSSVDSLPTAARRLWNLMENEIGGVELPEALRRLELAKGKKGRPGQTHLLIEVVAGWKAKGGSLGGLAKAHPDLFKSSGVARAFNSRHKAKIQLLVGKHKAAVQVTPTSGE
jgi:hypothetical protein